MKKGRILITGGAGFIGSHTADALAARGYRIRILDSIDPPVHAGKWPAYISTKGYELIRGDVREKRDWRRALKDVDFVFHLAAFQDQLPDFSRFFQVNTVSTALLYELLASSQFPVRKVVLASSQFVYGDGRWRCAHEGGSVFYPELREPAQLIRGEWDIVCPHGKRARFQPFREDQAASPTNSYGLSKIALEQIALRLGRNCAVPTVVLRYSIVQGPRQSPLNMYSGALRIFVMQSLAGEPITVYEDGNQLRDFVNIQDVVSANLLVLRDKLADFEVFNVGGGRGYRVGDFARMVKEITRSDSSIEYRNCFRKTDSRNAVSDIRKIGKLGWRPGHSPRKSIADFVAWFRQEGFDARRIRRAQHELRALGVVSS